MFSYECPQFDDIRIRIPNQCNVKGGCNIGLLWNVYINVEMGTAESNKSNIYLWYDKLVRNNEIWTLNFI